MIAKSNEKGFLTNLSSAQVSDRAEIIMVDCRVELVYIMKIMILLIRTRKTLKSKVEGKVIQLKEEKSLFSRFLITSRKRPELDLEDCLGNFEFSVVPKALFSTDGEPLLSTGKVWKTYYIILRSLENFISKVILKL